MEKEAKSRVRQEGVDEAKEVRVVEGERMDDGAGSGEVEVVEAVEIETGDARGNGNGEVAGSGAEPDLISWEAQEYIVRDKTAGWYVGLVAVGLVLAGIAVWLQWWTFLVVVILSVVALIIYAMRPPRMLSYGLTRTGVREGDHLYPYANFKAFGILQEGSNFAIVLTPRKRFSPRLTVFFPQAQGEKIVDAFGARLPMEEVKLDFLDRLIKFLRI